MYMKVDFTKVCGMETLQNQGVSAWWHVNSFKANGRRINDTYT
jgi:hypothetical protein